VTKSQDVVIAEMRKDIEYIKKAVDEIVEHNVTKAEYYSLKRRVALLERAVWGVAGFIVMSVIGYILVRNGITS